MSVKINRTAGLKYALASTINYWKSGIGTSRLAVQQEKKGLSPFIHSYSTFKRYVGCLNDLKKFCGEAYVRKLNQITPRTLEAFFKYKSTRGKGSENQPRFLSEKTMRIHLSVQCKFFALVNRPDLVNYINSHRGEILAPCRPFGKTQALSRPEAVIQGIKSAPHQAMAVLQYFTGARVGDLKKMSLVGNRLFISRSKGGLSRINDFSDRPQELAKIKELLPIMKTYLKSSDWKKTFKTYSSDYRAACRKVGEPRVSPHAFRATYVHLRIAQLEALAAGEKKTTTISNKTFASSSKVERYIDKNIAKGFASRGFYGTLAVTYYNAAGQEKETEYNLAHWQTSQEIGHQRTEITRYYLDG